MSGSQQQRLWMFVVVVAAAVASWIGYLIYGVPEGDGVFACYRILPEEMKSEMRLSADKANRPNIGFDGSKIRRGGESDKQIDGFINCIERVAGQAPRVNTVARLPAEPLGQTADRWGGPGLTLSLMPTQDDEILQNLRVGPAIGTKAEIITSWCLENRECVQCEPEEPDDDTTQVLIRLRSAGNAVKVQMPGNWPVPQANAKPWQLIDQEGNRYYFDCRRSG